MADEAFALSPINARASLPTDEDYAAIHEAFMETARGRWFLTEYAKRNRNADTRMVLDAVERIETSLAGQRQAQAEAEARALTEARAQAEALANAQAQFQVQFQAHSQAQYAQVDAQPQIDLWPELSRAFAKARIEVAHRLVREDNAQAFEAIRAAVETIKSVIWALRERGFDSRICDFLDIQANAITDGYTGLLAESSVASEAEVEVLAAFDALIEQVEALTRGGDAETEALDAVVDAVADAMGEDDGAAAAFADDVTAADATASAVLSLEASSVDLPEAPPAPPVEAAPVEFGAPDAAFREIYGDDGDIEIIDAAPLDEPAAPALPTEPELNKQRLFEAKLAPYRSSAGAQDIAAADDIEIVDTASAETVHAAPDPAPVARVPVLEMAPALPVEQPREKTASLGDALIANGVIQHPAAARPDPLAPFRRMSQAEKVALFT
jgi:hypothetical protein